MHYIMLLYNSAKIQKSNSNFKKEMFKEQFIDFFKLFKIYDLKKIQKTGQVKVVQDRILMRKILSVEGTVSTENYTTLICSQHPNILFKQQYLYLSGYCEPGKAFTFQITYFLSNKQNKLICSTMYKEDFKRKGDNLFHFRLKMPTQKWTILAIDLYSLVNWDQSFKNDQDLRLVFRISNIEIRANSKVRGIYQADFLFGPQNLPKDMELPLRGSQLFFQKFSFVVTGLNLTEEVKCEIQKSKQKTQSQKMKGDSQKMQKLKSKQKKSQSTQKTDNLRRSVNKDQKRNLRKNKPSNSQEVMKDNKRPPKGFSKIQVQKEKQSKKQQEADKTLFEDDEDILEEQALEPPKPAASLSLKIEAIEAVSVVDENIISCESLLSEPVRLQTHKKITKIYKGRLGKVLTAYIDGSVCIWDTIRKQSVFYFRSQLEQIKSLLMDYEGNIIIVGLDKLKREVIEIVSDGVIIFKQISNFNIKSIKLISDESFEFGLMSVGYENIRIWTISSNNNIINGYAVYLGKMSRNVTYNDFCIVETVAGNYGFVCDSEGYATKINIKEKKMQGVVRVDNCGIDHIRLIKYLNNEQKILVANEKGTIKLLSCTTMESELEYPLQHRIKSLFMKQNSKHSDIPNLVLQSYNKTLAELDLIDSTFHFLIRSHYQSITHIQYQKTQNKNSSLHEDKIITASSDSTMRIWKLIPLSDHETVLKEEYEFLINGQEITHICSVPSSKQSGDFVYIITDTNKIRKISSSNYQIIKEKSLPSTDRVISFSINHQGKCLLIICENHVILLDSELQVLQFRDLAEEYVGKKVEYQKRYLSGFNNHKKCFFFENPFTSCLQFYQLRDPSKPIFSIPSTSDDKTVYLQWINDHIHSITEDQYRLYDKDCLLRSVSLMCDDERQFKSNFVLKFVTMSYPLVCKAYELKNTSESFISLQVLNKSGLNQTIKMPESISYMKISKPIKNTEDLTESTWIGEIICSGTESFGLYAIKYTILNTPDLLLFQDYTMEAQSIGLFGETKVKALNYDGSNISFIANTKQQNMLDISFSENATIIMGNKSRFNFQPSKYNLTNFNPPTQLKKLYEDEEKVFEQCKNAIFGNFFDKPSSKQNESDEVEQSEIRRQQEPPENGKIKMKIFFGIDTRQSLVHDNSEDKKENESKYSKLGMFHWSSQSKLMTLLTNFQKTLLIHEFTQPQVSQKLLHLYSKPSSICLSLLIESDKQKLMNYLVICFNSIIKLYNANNKISYIRSIEIDLLIKDKHVIFSSFITNCNSFLVMLTYKLGDSKQPEMKGTVYKPKQNKLYIFVIEISTGKIVSSSYRQIRYVRTSRTRSQYQRFIRESFSLIPNRYSSNKSLQFILKGSNEISFYRVNSMFTLQTLELQQIYDLTKQKTQPLTAARYVKVQGDVYVLIGSENGSLIIVDSRSGGIVLVLMGLLEGKKGISGIEFVEEDIVDNELHSPSKLVLFCSGSNSIIIIPLYYGLNTLIKQVELNSTIPIPNNSSHSNHQSSPYDSVSSSLKYINLDSQITSISHLNNMTQQLILTKSSTLWLVDYEDYCSIKIFSAHSQLVNQVYMLMYQNQLNDHKLFISCSQDGYVKVSDSTKLQQMLQIYKPRKKASCLDVQGNFTVCGFKDEIYFYDTLKSQAKTFNYLGSLQVQNQSIIKIKNISSSDNYYLLTDQKVYIIFIRRKKSSNLTKSQLSHNSILKNNTEYLSQHSFSSRNLPKVQIQIEIQEITSFTSDTIGGPEPLWLQVNRFRVYDEFSMGFKGGRVQTWQRKCLKRTLNPLEQLNNVQHLQYYLIDVYTRKQCLFPYIQFISQTQYMISLSELNKIQIRNYKQHSIIKEICLSQELLDGVRTFKYVVLNCEEKRKIIGLQGQESRNNGQVINYMASLRNGPLIVVGDNYGYLGICDMNGLVMEKDKIFNSPIDSIQIYHQNSSPTVAFSVLLKSQNFISLAQVFY